MAAAAPLTLSLCARGLGRDWPGDFYLHCSWTLSIQLRSGSRLPRQDQEGQVRAQAGLDRESGEPRSELTPQGPYSLSVQSPCRLQLEGPQSSWLQAAPRQKCPVHWQCPSTQVPWPLQSGGWQRGSCTHTTVDTLRGQRHMLSWLQGNIVFEERLQCWPSSANPSSSLLSLLSYRQTFIGSSQPNSPSYPRAFAHAVLAAQKALPPHCLATSSSDLSLGFIILREVFPVPPTPFHRLR